MIRVPNRNIALDELLDIFGKEIVLQFYTLIRFALDEDADSAQGHFQIIIVVEGPAHQLTVAGPDDLTVGIEYRCTKYVGNTHDMVKKIFDGALVVVTGTAAEVGFAFVDQRQALDELGADQHFPLQQVLLEEGKIDEPGYRADADDRNESRQRKNPQQSPSLDESRQMHHTPPDSVTLPVAGISARLCVRVMPPRHGSGHAVFAARW